MPSSRRLPIPDSSTRARNASIAGAYRLGLVDQILARHGKRGLYTHSLFKYRTRLLDSLSPAIELGRSFVRTEYQRSFTALPLLWAGIGLALGGLALLVAGWAVRRR